MIWCLASRMRVCVQGLMALCLPVSRHQQHESTHFVMNIARRARRRAFSPRGGEPIAGSLGSGDWCSLALLPSWSQGADQTA